MMGSAQIELDVGNLTPEERRDMAVLVLSGYTFVPGNIYWRLMYDGKQVGGFERLPILIKAGTVHVAPKRMTA